MQRVFLIWDAFLTSHACSQNQKELSRRELSFHARLESIFPSTNATAAGSAGVADDADAATELSKTAEAGVKIVKGVCTQTGNVAGDAARAKSNGAPKRRPAPTVPMVPPPKEPKKPRTSRTEQAPSSSSSRSAPTPTKPPWHRREEQQSSKSKSTTQ